MIKKETYKLRFRMLVGGFVSLFLIAGYLFSTRSYPVIQSNKALKEAFRVSGQAPELIVKLKNELENTEKHIAITAYDHELLLETINHFCKDEGISIKSFPEHIRKDQDEYAIIRDRIELEGGFTPLVRLIHFLEKEKKLGSVIHANFQLIKGRRNLPPRLELTLFLENIQRIKKQSDEI